ncbi:MAG: tRNA pseudouridine(38-40) synthase TruA [Gammaproteobacteria bacterium]|nr:tRNA pseudouridine(38-40) synthase TruA [Gammaproteobacteria bacterium]
MKIAMCVSYKGTNYCGWQAQEAHPSVQRTIEHALSQMANHQLIIHCAGRTDAGVHASKQVFHFETTTIRELFQWVQGTNFYLPKDVRILSATIVDEDFNARFSAIARIYHYVIYNQPIDSVFLRDLTTCCRHAINIDHMQKAAEALLGEHDFSAFRGSRCQSLSPVRTMHSIRIQRNGDFVYITFKANAFLHHMVRNIVGSLLEVGLAKKKPGWLEEVLFSKDRRYAGMTAPAEGLYLADVIYPSPYIFPQAPFPFSL